MAESGRLPPAAPAPSTEGLPRAFLQSLRTLFDILDDRQRGYVHLREIESRWQGADARELPCGVLEGLRQVAPANGYLTFERFVAGLRTSLLNANGRPKDQARVAPRSGDQPLLQQRLMFAPADEPRTVLERKPLPPSARSAPAGPSGISRNPELLCVPAEAAPSPEEPKRPPSKALERSPSADAGTAACRTLDTGKGEPRQTPRARGERRRHTITNGVDCGLLKQMKELDQEQEVLLQGLEMMARGREWYQQQLQRVQERQRRLSQSRAAAADLGTVGSPLPLGRLLPKVQEVARCLGELLTAACSGRALPSSSLGPLGPTSPSTPVWQQQTILMLKEQNRLLTQYGIVLDAGSSHTSMFVYKWPADKENDTGIVGQHSSCDVQGGGISSYANDPSRAGQSLVECLEQALRDVPKDKHASTPLYLGATAGMRLLNLTNPEATARVLEAVTRVLTRYPFDFRGARILSGQDEGVFGWVTANYLLENFIKYGWVGRWIRPRKGTLGAMDLGGASTQITFETTSPSEDPDNEVHLRLYGQHYRVYTHSFLCYGRDQVLQRLLASALQIDHLHPCWPKGYSTQVLLREVYQSPCTMGQRPQTFNSSGLVRVSGTSNPALCRDLVSGLFNFSACPFSQCSFNGVFQPPVTGNFIAFSAFYYTVDFLRTVMRLPMGTLQQLEAATEIVCNQTWAELQARVPGQQARLADYCAVAMFIQQLLSRGYHFDERSFSGVVFQKKAADTAVGWALGYMLNLTNMIPADLPRLRKGTHFSSWVALLLLFAVLLLAALVLVLRQTPGDEGTPLHRVVPESESSLTDKTLTNLRSPLMT
ncbi:hypothetical protein STEG23_001085 [Scotinomys teguina]